MKQDKSKPETSLGALLKGKPLPTLQSKGPPVWKGPSVDGVTFSLLNRFLGCRERFRIYAIEGLTADYGFNHKIEYGSMWHVCEEALASGSGQWLAALQAHCRSLSHRYHLHGSLIDHWYNVCKVQFPVYVDYWLKHRDVTERTPLMQEEPFKVPYSLPSGRMVFLRGKFDSVDAIGQGSGTGIYLQENKTKGDIREEAIRRQLRFDLQTMIYLIALHEISVNPEIEVKSKVAWRKAEVLHSKRLSSTYPIKGVRYNVVRRPLSGGKGTIVRHKATKNKPEETKESFYSRLREYIEAEPETYFMRWQVEITKEDVKAFKEKCLNPLLEQLCDWYEHVTGPSSRESPFWCRPAVHDYMIHWQHPFGCYNILDEGGSSDLDEYLATGSTAGLGRIATVFPEL